MVFLKRSLICGLRKTRSCAYLKSEILFSVQLRPNVFSHDLPIQLYLLLLFCCCYLLLHSNETKFVKKKNSCFFSGEIVQMLWR